MLSQYVVKAHVLTSTGYHVKSKKESIVIKIDKTICKLLSFHTSFLLDISKVQSPVVYRSELSLIHVFENPLLGAQAADGGSGRYGVCTHILLTTEVSGDVSLTKTTL